MKNDSVQKIADMQLFTAQTAESADIEPADSAESAGWNPLKYCRFCIITLEESARDHYQEKIYEQNNKIHTFSRLSSIILQNLRESPFQAVYVDYLNHNLRQIILKIPEFSFKMQLILTVWQSGDSGGSRETIEVKVRQIRNDFFKPTFLPKNEQTNSTLLLVDLFSFVFWKKVKTPKRHFEIN